MPRPAASAANRSMAALAAARTSTRTKFALLLPRLDAGEVEKVEDELPHPVQPHQAAVDHRQPLRRLVGLQDLEVSLDGVDGGL